MSCVYRVETAWSDRELKLSSSYGGGGDGEGGERGLE